MRVDRFSVIAQDPPRGQNQQKGAEDCYQAPSGHADFRDGAPNTAAGGELRPHAGQVRTRRSPGQKEVKGNLPSRDDLAFIYALAHGTASLGWSMDFRKLSHSVYARRDAGNRPLTGRLRYFVPDRRFPILQVRGRDLNCVPFVGHHERLPGHWLDGDVAIIPRFRGL